MRAVLESFRSGDPVAIALGVWLLYFAFHGASLGLEKAFPGLQRRFPAHWWRSVREFLIAQKHNFTDLVRNGRAAGHRNGATMDLVERKSRIPPWLVNGFRSGSTKRPACPDILKPLYDAAAPRVRKAKDVFEFVPFTLFEQHLPTLVRDHKLVYGSLFPTLKHLLENEDLRIVGKFMTPCSYPVWLFGRRDQAFDEQVPMNVESPGFWTGKRISVYGKLMSTTVLLLDWLHNQNLYWRFIGNGNRPEPVRPNREVAEGEEVIVEVMNDHTQMLWCLERGDHDLAWIPYPLNMSDEAQEACEMWARPYAGPVNWNRWKDHPLNVAVTDLATLRNGNGMDIVSMLEFVAHLNSELQDLDLAYQLYERWKTSRDKDEIITMLEALTLEPDPWIVNKSAFADKICELWECGVNTHLLPAAKLNGQLVERIVTKEALTSPKV